MKPSNGMIVAIFLVAACSREHLLPDHPEEASRRSLGVIPPSEIATWNCVDGNESIDSRYLQAAAFDEDRKIFVMFGGVAMPATGKSKGTLILSQETLEWNPANGRWHNRTGTGTMPDARSGAALAYDSDRKKFVLFGGLDETGYHLEDTWEWDPGTGVWTPVMNAGPHPSARFRHSMVYQQSSKKVLLFGGGYYDEEGQQVALSLGETWEWDPATKSWTLYPESGTAPSARHDVGLVWDTVRAKVVLFAGFQKDMIDVDGIPKQDVWEWDPVSHAWAERTVVGTKPSVRYGHATAFAGTTGRLYVFGGWDIATGGALNDLWGWNSATGEWKEILGSRSKDDLPTPRMYASSFFDDSHERLYLLGGVRSDNFNFETDKLVGLPQCDSGASGNTEVWEFDPLQSTFVDRNLPLDLPSPRSYSSMTHHAGNGKVYLYGGTNQKNQYIGDFWEWDGAKWSQIATDSGPTPRYSVIAYDPARSTIILFGGTDDISGILGDTWEFSPPEGKWLKLDPVEKPEPIFGHKLITDTTRKTILLLGGTRHDQYSDKDNLDMWEWDGSKVSWTRRSLSLGLTTSPKIHATSMAAYDEGRRKVVLFEPGSIKESTSAFWEWDPISAGWEKRDPQDLLEYRVTNYMAYDSIRRREVIFAEHLSTITGPGSTWELDTGGPTFYVRNIPKSPASRNGAAMAFDSKRGVMVLFGGHVYRSADSIAWDDKDETWIYKVSGWGKGMGCTSETATTCASGFCVDGVCCEEVSCSGPCISCNVPGSEGTCFPVKAGTVVPGSCSDGNACDSTGTCKSANGQPCKSEGTCASGHCSDAVCCDSPCDGICSSCNLQGRVGRCSPYTVGTDPQNECGVGKGTCKSTCDGVGQCAFPTIDVVCGDCMGCDGAGTCVVDNRCHPSGGGGGASGTGGSIPIPSGTGGSGGIPIPSGTGGSGGIPIPSSTGGSGGGGTVRGGTGGARLDGSGGKGGSGTGSAGTAGSIPGGAGGSGGITHGLDSGGNGSGTDGSIPAMDTGSPVLGPVGDGGDGKAGSSLHRSGCDCEVGRTARPAPGPSMIAPLLIAGVALVFRRIRRRN
jgi:MYXO-CTERM domain-containing protein